MSLLLEVLLLSAAILLLVPIALLFIECLTATLTDSRRNWEAMQPRPNMAVLLPAHNEATVIGDTLAQLTPQLLKQDRLIVVADNCDDETAAIAKTHGAIVLERKDDQRRGKGYALDFGLSYLASSPPDVVVVVDADCMVEFGALEKVARQAVTYNRPVQATYLMETPASLRSKDTVSILAFTVKNLVRPLGLAGLGLPCLLTGTGMAFPWSVLQKISLASGNIVEDMKLGLDLALVGHPPMFCAEARVTGVLPQQSQATKSQRTRWEHGHLSTIRTEVPPLIWAAVQKRRFDLFAIALDLLIPPLSLLVILWLAVMAIATGFSLLGGSPLPAMILAGEGLLVFTAIFVSWMKFARKELPLRTLLSVPLYILWKIPLYLKFLVKPQTRWVRTERDVPNSSNH